MMEEKFVLGIDMGTTSVKVCLVNATNLDMKFKVSEPTNADIIHDSRYSEQSVTKIVITLQQCISHLDENDLKKVIGIGVCGQEHGIVLWNSSNDRPWKSVVENGKVAFEIDDEKVSNLYTWQDGRCDTDFLSTLPQPDSYLKAYTGYGCNTLFWLARNEPIKLEKYNCAGTIADFVVCMLCDLEKPLMSSLNAPRWGYFNTEQCRWNINILSAEGFPVHFLPSIAPPEHIAGYIAHSCFSIPVNTPVGVALPDMQCSVLAALNNTEEAYINISTSAQLAFITSDFDPEQSNKYPIEYLPYFGKKYLVVAPALNGGNALATFVRSLQQWFSEFGIYVSSDELWNRLVGLDDQSTNESSLNVIPTFLGERHAPNQTASIVNITPQNFNLPHIFNALCRGIVQNIHCMMPQNVLIDAGIKRIIASGSALTRNKILLSEVENCYQLPVIFNTARDSPYGAAISVISSLKK